MRSACPLTYSPSKARLQIPSRRGLLCLAFCPRREQPSAAGRHTKPPGTWEGLGGSSGRFLLPFPSPGTEEGERSQPGAAQGPGRGEGGGSGSACASRQDAGRRGGSALGFCEGKLLYPPVLTPRSTARLREGKM